MRLQLDRLVERRLLGELTPVEQARMEALQEIETDLLQAARLVKKSKSDEGATAQSERPKR